MVMGCGWYREPFYPAEDLIDRRNVDDLAERLVQENPHGRRRLGHPAGRHRRDRRQQRLG